MRFSEVVEPDYCQAARPRHPEFANRSEPGCPTGSHHSTHASAGSLYSFLLHHDSHSMNHRWSSNLRLGNRRRSGMYYSWLVHLCRSTLDREMWIRPALAPPTSSETAPVNPQQGS